MIVAAPQKWSIAYSRFGLGARGGCAPRSGDPREALIAELDTPRVAELSDPSLKPTAVALREVYADREARKAEREAIAFSVLASMAMPEPALAALTIPEPTRDGCKTLAKPAMPMQQSIFREEARARIGRACAAPIGFVERLVAFWSNHFCVSVGKNDLGRATAGAFEREAIRPNVLGRFADMLLAVERHPAMLNFLDNTQSLGPNSIAGHSGGRGLNENLGREILELHTMGVGSGYTQNDVTQLANILTGWTIVGREGRLGQPEDAIFNANAHEPLAAVVRDRLYLQDGAAQGEAALRDLAAEPATAAHLARKFARAFVADEPERALVDRLAKVFVDTDGNLAALARTLIEDERSWAAPAAKFRDPWEWMTAAYRAFDRPPTDPSFTIRSLNLLGMPLWQPAGPNGYSTDTAAWASPEGLKTRVELASLFAAQVKAGPHPLALADAVLPEASAATREAVAHAETPEQAYALLILSPEFQRR